MRYRCENGVFVVNLDRGDDVRSSIERLAADSHIVGAEVTAIGALEDAELGFYLLDERRYLRRKVPGIVELVSLHGNLALKDGKPFLHAHVALGKKDFSVVGGHLFDAKAGVVVEAFIRPLPRPLVRLPRKDVGLSCWSLED